MKPVHIIAVVAVALVPLASGADFGHSCCPQCGCHQYERVCRIVPTVTRVPKVEYCLKCEDVCTLGKSHFKGFNCVPNCDGTCCKVPCFEPKCGKVYKRYTPEKTITYVEKCGYKCVVEHICRGCGCTCHSHAVDCAAPVGAPMTGSTPSFNAPPIQVPVPVVDAIPSGYFAP